MGFREPTFWRDNLGMLRLRWFLSLVLTGGALLLGALLLGGKALEEGACNQTAKEYRLPEGDWRFLSMACYVTLPNGEKIDAANLRAQEGVTR